MMRNAVPISPPSAPAALDDHAAVDNEQIVRAGPLVWHVRPAWADRVPAGGPADWTDLSACPDAQLIKRNAQRSVWRLRQGDDAFYVKVYHPARWLDRLKNLRRGPAAASEWRSGCIAQRCGLAVVEPVAYAVDANRPAAAPSVLVTQELARALPLDEYWDELGDVADERCRHRQARGLIESLADSVAAAHRAGLWHHDLHAGNLLVQPQPNGSPRVVFVDLHNVRVAVAVTERQAVRNLVQLNQWFARHASRADRLRFLRVYLARRRSAAGEVRAPERHELARWAHAVAARARGHAANIWAKRDRRARRRGKYFAPVRLGGGWRGHVFLQCKRPVDGSRASRLTFTVRQWQEWLRDPSRFFAAARPDQILKDSHTGHVCRLELPLGDAAAPLRVIAKRPRSRSMGKRLWHLVRPSRPLQTFCRGHALVHRELPTALPLATLQRRVAGFVVDGLVITEEIADTEDLDTMLRMRLLHEPPARQRQVKAQLRDALVTLYAHLHERGCMHRDMKAPNLLVQWSADRDDPPRITLVDLDGVRIQRRLSWPQCLRMMMRLSVSLEPCRIVTRTDRLRFLEAYLAPHPDRARNWKAVWREIAAASSRKHNQKAKRHAWKMKHYGRG